MFVGAGQFVGWMERGEEEEGLDSFPVAEINNILFSVVLDTFPTSGEKYPGMFVGLI